MLISKERNHYKTIVGKKTATLILYQKVILAYKICSKFYITEHYFK